MDQDLKATLSRIAGALDRLAPPVPASADITAAEAYVWHAAGHRLEAVPKVNRVSLGLLMGIDRQKETLLENTRRFARALPANNALLWGSRGSGKSSIVKAVHAQVNREMGGPPGPLALIEIHREDIPSLPALLSMIRPSKRRFVVFCDDLSFDGQDAAYKSLKAVLEGGIEGRPDNVVFYATSNRPFFAMIEGYADHYKLGVPAETLRKQAVEWSVTRGARSGRVAWQFIQEVAGHLGKKLE